MTKRMTLDELKADFIVLNPSKEDYEQFLAERGWTHQQMKEEVLEYWEPQTNRKTPPKSVRLAIKRAKYEARN